eukprot:624619_1
MGSSCNSETNIAPESKAETRQVDIKTCDIYGLYNVIAEGTRDLVLLDMRPASAYKENHIEASIHFDITNPRMYNAMAARLSKYVHKKLIQTHSIYILYDKQHTSDQMREMNQYVQSTVIPLIQKESSWLHFKSIYYCSLFQDFQNTFAFLMTTKPVEIEEEDHKEAALHPIPVSIFGKHMMFPSCIIPDELYLGNSRNAADGDTLKALGITHIVNVTSNVKNLFEADGIEYLQCVIEDSPKANINQFFEETIQFINGALADANHHKVFVHCQAGISRSASIVIAYIMNTRGHGTRGIPKFEDALAFVRERRPMVHPNDGFTMQLMEYETRTSKIPYKHSSRPVNADSNQ